MSNLNDDLKDIKAVDRGIENVLTPGCIRTFTGKYVNLANPQPSTLNITDIAHALSLIPRWNGHTYRPYSVAQHSVMVCEWLELVEPGLDKNIYFTALMHDAAEAYTGDISSPLKKILGDRLTVLEYGLNIELASKFGFSYPFPSKVKAADEFMLYMEWDHVMLQKPVQGDTHLEVMSAEVSNFVFLETFERLKPSVIVTVQHY